MTEARSPHAPAPRRPEWRPSRRFAARVELRAFLVARAIWWRLPERLRDRIRPLLPPPGGFRLSPIRRGRTAFGAADPGTAAAESSVVRPAAPFPHVPESVSVVVPTLDAGSLFRRVLASIRAQEGIGALELVVVDSGSSDGTRELAAEADARVLDVDRTAFGHGRTRNLAADATSGDVIVMMVQDAVLLGPSTLRALVLELHHDASMAAVSARQVARADADLYGAFVVWAHERLLWSADGTSRVRAGAAAERRAAATVDNVCAAFPAAAWRELRFSDVPFGEDLDFGLRAVAKGWRVGFAPAAAVSHSHTRGSAYHLRRSLVDRLHVASLVGDDRLDRAAAHGVAAVAAGGQALLREVAGALIASPVETSLVEHLARFRSTLAGRPAREEPAGELALLATALPAADGASGDAALDVLRQSLLAVAGWDVLDAFARAHPAVGRDAFALFAANLTASVLGRALGDAARGERDAPWVEPLVAGV